MNTRSLPTVLSAVRRAAAAAAVSLLAVCSLALVAPSIRAAEAGIISGSVSNAATRNQLQGAVVEVPVLSLTALTDNTGR